MPRARDGPGTVYILSNPSFQSDILKVGRTGRDVGPALRARQLRSTGVPSPFTVEACFACSRMCAVERVTHELLVGSRVALDREFFKISLSRAVEIVRRARAWTSWSALTKKAKEKSA